MFMCFRIVLYNVKMYVMCYVIAFIDVKCEQNKFPLDNKIEIELKLKW